MSFFKKMSFARFVIVTGLVLNIGMGWLTYKMRARHEEVTMEVKKAPELVQEIQQLGIEVAELQKAKSLDTLSALGDPEVYIRMMSQKERVAIGDVDIGVATKGRTQGIEDKVYTIKPIDRSRGFTRTAIANFIYSLEENSRRVVVTTVDMSPSAKGSQRPHEIGNDRWTFKIELTSRQRK